MLELSKVTDPRSALEKMRRRELEFIARYYEISEIDPQMPAPLMRKIIQRKGVQIPPPLVDSIGFRGEMRLPPYDVWKEWAFGNAHKPLQEEEKTVEEVNADDLLEAQWKMQKAQVHKHPSVNYSLMKRAQLMKMAKARGVKIQRTDSRDDLIGKLEALDGNEDAS